MKLTTLVANPELAKSTSKSSYQYEVLFNNKKVVCSSHIDTVITVLKLLAESKLIDLSDIEENERMAGFHLVLDVSDIKTSEEIVKMIESSIPKYKSRYQVKKFLTVGNSKYIVCNQWIPKRVDDFVNKFTAIANSKIEDKKKHLSVTRL